MRIQMLRLKGYSGISSGLLRDEITIDFSSSLHKICLIKGATGSGKSTILEAITPLPNDNNMLDPTQQAEKEIIFNNGIRILIIHPLSNKGERATTKAYIYENGINLNPNGNVTSYKEIVFDKLELDSNFEALSKLSTRDRGLADKTPAIRKKYVANIIDSVEVYNNIYKTLTKHSSTLKSMLQSIVAKMDSIGDKKTLDENIKALENLVKEYEKKKDEVSFNNASALAIVTTLDPDGSIMSNYNTLVNRQAINQNQIEVCNNALSSHSNSFHGDIKIATDYRNGLERQIAKLQSDIKNKENGLNSLIDRSDIENENLNKKITKLKKLTDDANYDVLVSNIQSVENELKMIEDFFNQIHMKDAIALSSDEYKSGINILNKIIDMIRVLMEKMGPLTSEERSGILHGATVEITAIRDEEFHTISLFNNNISEINKLIAEQEGKLSVYANLKQRPDNCKIDDCPFIKSALEIIEDPQQVIDKLREDLAFNRKMIEKCNREIEHYNEAIEISRMKDDLFMTICSNEFILSKLPGVDILIKNNDLIDFLCNRISSNDLIPSFTPLYENINKAYMFDQYKKLKQQLEKLYNQRAIFESKHDIIDEINEDIDRIRSNLRDISDTITKEQQSIYALKDQLVQCEQDLNHTNSIIKMIEAKDMAERDYAETQSKLDNLSSDIIKIRDANATIAATRETLEEINNSLKPVREDLNRNVYNRKRLEEYREEMSVYKDRYEKTETVKEFTSPTKDGIQLLFMEIYMNNILSTANNLLSKVFNGQFMLQPFVINGDEFRIPCVGNRLMNDDISSMSTGQICMISMILSFSILYNSSSKYNIIKLDEIDGGFDTDNRSSFINILNEIIGILGCEQCFLISHNEEIQYSSTDMILLRTNSDNRDYGDANVIFDVRNN